MSSAWTNVTRRFHVSTAKAERSAQRHERADAEVVVHIETARQHRAELALEQEHQLTMRYLNQMLKQQTRRTATLRKPRVSHSFIRQG